MEGRSRWLLRVTALRAVHRALISRTFNKNCNPVIGCWQGVDGIGPTGNQVKNIEIRRAVVLLSRPAIERQQRKCPKI
jgi:hypothetical protein